MTYSKQQTQTLVLVALVGLIIAVVAYMGMIKPNLGRASTYKKNVKKYADELTEQQRVIKKNLDTVHRTEAIEARTATLEEQLYHGLFAGRLTSSFEELRHTHGFDFRFQQDLEQIQPLESGRHYELSNRFTLLACDFYELVRLIQVLETTNPGVRVSDFEIRAHSPDEPDGLIDAQIELRLIGFKDGSDEPWTSASEDTFRPEKRNPFSPPGFHAVVDPNAPMREQLANIRYNGTLGGAALIRPTQDASAELIEAGEYLPFFKEKIRLVKHSSHVLILCHEPTQTHYKLTLYASGDRVGQVKQVEEIPHE